MFLPPPLTYELARESVTAEFANAIDTAHQSFIDRNCTSFDKQSDEDMNPCIEAWISSPGGYGPGEINAFINSHKTDVKDWITENQMGEGWSNKVGFIATKADASFTLRFNDIAKDVRVVTIYFIRSYGEKWKDSRAKFTISRVQEKEGGGTSAFVVSEDVISGIHDDVTHTHSPTLDQSMVLSETILKGESIEMKVDLVSGSHFKIMGMMLCEK
eukprot:12177023-Ditylum_brightwellii.AAC.1